MGYIVEGFKDDDIELRNAVSDYFLRNYSINSIELTYAVKNFFPEYENLLNTIMLLS